MIPAPMPVPILTTTTFVVARGDARSPLPERQDVDVVVDPDRRPIAAGEPLADRVAVPARHDRRRDRPAGPELDRARDADPDAPQPARDACVVCEQLIEQRRRRGRDSASGPASIRGRLVVVAEDPAVEGRQRDVDARRAEVGDEDVAGIRPERELARRPAAGARPDVALDDESAVDQLADPLGDDRPAETGPLDELGRGTATARGGSRRGPTTSASRASSGSGRRAPPGSDRWTAICPDRIRLVHGSTCDRRLLLDMRQV